MSPSGKPSGRATARATVSRSMVRNPAKKPDAPAPQGKKRPKAPTTTKATKVTPLLKAHKAAAAPAAEKATEANLPVEERIYRAVFDSVMDQRLTPGTKLPEAGLCELFHVSRSQVRKVLQRLAHDHIVQLRPNRGAVVAVPSPHETRRVFEARRALEAALLPLAVTRARPTDLADLRRQLADEHEALHRYDQPAWARLASGFHLRVAALADNPILLGYLKELVSRCSLIVAVYEPPGNAVCEHHEHARIVDLIEAGDAAGALRVMDEHLCNLEQRISLDQEPASRSLAHMLGLV